MSKLGGYLRLIRPMNCILMGFAVIVGAALARPDALGGSWLILVYGFIAGFTLTGASMNINDCYDREIDAINEPQRPIPSGLIKPRDALIFGFILTAIGLVAAFLTSISSLAIATVAWLVFATYTTVGKRTGLPGNFLVSLSVSIPFVYGSVAIAGTLELNVLMFASMAFLSNTGREITKGIVDAEGDRKNNVKTLAVSLGEAKASTAGAVFYLLAVSLSPIPLLLNLVSLWFIPFVAVTDIGLATSSFMLLRNHSRENARKIKNTVLLWFLVGLLAFIAGTIRVA